MTLIFYEVEEQTYKKSYSKKLNPKSITRLHKKICKKFGIETKLKFNNKTLGYYDTELNEIGLPENATLGVLIHEIAHAYEHKKFGITYHKGRLFQIINEINIQVEGMV